MGRTLLVVVVEDNTEHRDVIGAELRRAYPGIEILEFSTEHGFYEALEEIEGRKPDLFIVDIMLTWAHMEEGVELPEPPGDRDMGGFRCVERIRARRALAASPVLLYSLVLREDVNKELLKLRKSHGAETFFSKDPSLANLSEAVAAALPKDRRARG